MIKVGSKAKIVSGKNTGWYIWIQDDTEIQEVIWWFSLHLLNLQVMAMIIGLQQ